MECILKCKNNVFTGDSISEVETNFFEWLGKQESFIVDNYSVLGVSKDSDGIPVAKVLKDTTDLQRRYGYVYVVCVDLGEDVEEWEDATYEASYHLNKGNAIAAAKKVFELNEKAVSTRVVAHRVGGVIDNHNMWDNDFDIMCAHFNRTNSPATSSYSWED